MQWSDLTKTDITDDMIAMLDLFKENEALLPDCLPEGWDDKRAHATVVALNRAGYRVHVRAAPQGGPLWELEGNSRGVRILSEDAKTLLRMCGTDSGMIFPEALPEGWTVDRVREQTRFLRHAGFPFEEFWTPDMTPFWGLNYNFSGRIYSTMM